MMKNIFKIDLARKKLIIEENGKFDIVENEDLTLKTIVIDKDNTSIKIIGILTNV